MFKRPNVSLVALTAVALVALAGCVIAPSAGPTTPDGLEKRPSSKVDSLYAAPGASLVRYKKVMLDDLDVAFKADWEIHHPGISASEINDIRTLGARLFRAAFSSELEKGGYPVVTAPGPDVLRVKAAVVDVDFAASSAAAAGVGGAYIVSTADISLVGELRDSQSGAVIARVIDKNRGRNVGTLQMSSEANPSKEALQAFSTWAGLLREALDDARKPLTK